jgi:hypothetical protein
MDRSDLALLDPSAQPLRFVGLVRQPVWFCAGRRDGHNDVGDVSGRQRYRWTSAALSRRFIGSEKGKAMRQAVSAAGTRLLFLPKYSPDNPIEQVLAQAQREGAKTRAAHPRRNLRCHSDDPSPKSSPDEGANRKMQIAPNV